MPENQASCSPLPKAKIFVLAFCLLIASALGGNALIEIFIPPFTNAELKSSLIDTWEVHTLYSVAAMAVLALLGGASTLLALFSATRGRALAVISISLCTVSFLMVAAQNSILTEQAATATGENLETILGIERASI